MPLHPPSARFDLAEFGDLLGDPSRAAMLLSLMDGLARPASELARIAGITASTASAHLSRLQSGGLVHAQAQGRHRYFRLASDEVAHAIEVITLQSARRSPTEASGPKAIPIRPAPPRPTDPVRVALGRARTCYKHLAGELGVAWFAALEQQRLLRIHDGAIVLAPRGFARFVTLGIELDEATPGRPCLDWTERRNHLGGPLGVKLTQSMFDLGWVARRSDGRALRVTSRGRAALGTFGVAIER